MDDITDILKDIETIITGNLDQPVEPLTSGPVEVLVNNNWTPVNKETFESWTGLRRVWGIEYHGPVKYKDCKNGSTYTGPRTCHCATCQSTVEPHFKPN